MRIPFAFGSSFIHDVGPDNLFALVAVVHCCLILLETWKQKNSSKKVTIIIWKGKNNKTLILKTESLGASQVSPNISVIHNYRISQFCNLKK